MEIGSSGPTGEPRVVALRLSWRARLVCREDSNDPLEEVRHLTRSALVGRGYEVDLVQQGVTSQYLRLNRRKARQLERISVEGHCTATSASAMPGANEAVSKLSRRVLPHIQRLFDRGLVLKAYFYGAE